MIDLEQFDKITSHELKIRKQIDSSGDYETATYDIFAHYEWGNKSIVYGIENPNDALLFASAPELIKEIKELRNENVQLKNKIIMAVRDLTET